MNIQELKEKVIAGYELSYEEGVALTQVENKEALYQAADEIRLHFCGTKMDLCSITNAKSGKCPQDCKWCSQSGHYETGVETYDLIAKEKVIAQVLESAANGVNRHSLVTSGRKASDRTIDNMIEIYDEIKEQSDIHLCASMGLLEEKQLEKLRDTGIDHYHCNLETAPSYFPEVCTTHSMDEKIETIKSAQSLGLKVCSGGIIGMGENMNHRVELACTLRDLRIMSIPLNILTQVDGTPLEKVSDLTEEEILTTIAVFRFINPKANLRFAGGRLKIKDFQDKALRAGINSALTGDYLTTIGSNTAEDIRDFKAAGFDIGK
ncbi:biotin synthase BioB [Flammeovirgaceae bacterium SG7u.111]|nr:biotin synthase BioB [Flammeovirgaceae bacterium SG7u.132]WPO36466.1 biotin synthase BioB [Flammeovirgaceae bacterium SG7u.111]